MPPRPAPPTVRTAAPRDDVAMAGALARSFFDDPVMVWLLPEPATREARLCTFFRTEIDHAHANGVALTTSRHDGAALWLAPKRWRVDLGSMARHSPRLLKALGRSIPKALAIQTAMEKAHPKDEHWYLAVLGTDPERQGLGVGAALITGVTDRCDASGTAAYLESSKAANVPYYERFGFVVTGEIQVRDSPILYSMWRDPR